MGEWMDGETQLLISWSFSSVQFNRSVISSSLQPHGLQHARLPCPLPTPRVYSNSCPLSRWCHPTISSSVVPFSSWEICMQVKKQQLELDMEQQTGSKSRKEYIKAEYCHPAYLTYMQSTSCEMLGWMKHKLQSRLPGETAITSKTQMIWPLWWKVKKSKEPLDESERGEWKSWLKTRHSEN